MIQEIKEKGRLPIKIWASELESDAINQARNVASLSVARYHVSLMPDAHPGYGMPIGGVCALEKAIMPGGVGYDIGCGMQLTTIFTRASNLSKAMLEDIVHKIQDAIPMGLGGKHIEATTDLEALMPKRSTANSDVLLGEYRDAVLQLGTLGSGNHFIELQVDDNGELCVMIHSGSRKLGHSIADHFIKEAIRYCEASGFEVPDRELAWLPEASIGGKRYLADMAYCLEYARTNRSIMMDNALHAVFEVLKDTYMVYNIDIHHNYAVLEKHFGEPLWVHRKGATLADKKTIGVIPGSQGTASYTVRGLGNPDSFTSCSHGAGRKMGRAAARRSLDLEKEKKHLDSQGIIHTMNSQHDLDEAPSAYKDIDEVMVNQADLVTPIKRMRPLAVMKG